MNQKAPRILIHEEGFCVRWKRFDSYIYLLNSSYSGMDCYWTKIGTLVEFCFHEIGETEIGERL